MPQGPLRQAQGPLSFNTIPQRVPEPVEGPFGLVQNLNCCANGHNQFLSLPKHPESQSNEALIQLITTLTKHPNHRIRLFS
jgi:hypothetical protein